MTARFAQSRSGSRTGRQRRQEGRTNSPTEHEPDDVASHPGNRTLEAP